MTYLLFAIGGYLTIGACIGSSLGIANMYDVNNWKSKTSDSFRSLDEETQEFILKLSAAIAVTIFWLPWLITGNLKIGGK